MKYTILGKTGLRVSRTAFGALPIQRVDDGTAVEILHRAYDGGINFYDTARAYSDSEHKLGLAFCDRRDKIVIASKTSGTTPAELQSQLETTLGNLRTDYLDLLQFHNPKALPDDGMMAWVTDVMSKGYVRHIGITFHPAGLARDAVRSGLFETLQYPFSCLSGDEEVTLAQSCADAGMGFIAMKAMAGGLISNVPANFAYIRQYEHIVPIWGVQRMSELEQFLGLEEGSGMSPQDMQSGIIADRAALDGRFCRGCGYCKPCPAEIPLEMASRMDLFLRRGVWQDLLSPAWQKQMAKIEDCISCGACNTRCPYGLEPQKLIIEQWEYYQNFMREKGVERVV